MKVKLANRGNPDFGQDPNKPLWDKPPDKWVKVKDLEHASHVCRLYIVDHELGGGSWAGGQIKDNKGKEIGRVSYNGKVWPPGEWKPDMEPLYDPAKMVRSTPNRYHLNNVFHVNKATLKRNFANSAVQDEKVARLLEQRGQVYTLAEIKLLSGYLWTAHDECVTANPDDYLAIQVTTAQAKIDAGGLVLERIKRYEALEKQGLI